MQKIMFNDRYGLTQAVLNGTKTMTRRLEKALERAVAEYEKQYGEPFEIISQCWDEYRMYVLTNHGTIYINTRYRRGEVVAVAQSYKAVFEETLDYAIPRYHWLDDHIGKKGFLNKMFVKANEMPHQIQITDIKIERLQDITDEDCLKEGVLHSDKYAMPYGIPDSKAPNRVFFFYSSPREAFADLINHPGVGRKGLWESNPFVVVYEFKLICRVDKEIAI